MKRGAAASEPSNADLVHEVVRSAERLLTFEEIFARVDARRPVTTAQPRETIRGALSQGPQLVNVGEGRYGYLPRLIEGSVLRLPLTQSKPANHPLIYPDEVRQALFPSCRDIQKRRSERPAHARLPNGEQVELPLEFHGAGTWGSTMPDGLRRFLVDHRAAAGDSLLIRVVSGEAGACEMWFEPCAVRDKQAVARRNRELADASERLLRNSRSGDVLIWDVMISLLAQGAYRSDVAPDPLENVLGSDARFVAAGFFAWMLADNVTPAMRVAIRKRQEHEAQLFGVRPVPEALPATRAAAPSLQAVREQLMAALTGLSVSQTAGSSTRLRLVRSGQAPTRPVRAGWRPKRSGPRRISQLKVTLKGIRPPIWRRLLVPSDTTLERLHQILQLSMGWYDSHLHQFVVDGVQYGVLDDDLGMDVQDEGRVSLADVAPAAGHRLVYEYDFGDGWEHELLVEKVLEPSPDVRYPVCLKGKRACPPEDVGGIWGYAELLEILSDPGHPEHQERLEWIGGEFDPEAFDADAVNAALASLV